MEDHAGDKQPDQQLDTDKAEKTNEEKDNEASKISHEDTVQSHDLIAEGPTEPKQDSHAEEIPAETVKPGPEAAVDEAVSAHVVTDAEETRQEHSETQDEQREDGLSQTAEGDRDSVKAEEQKEADTENEQAEDEPDKTGIVEEEEETQEEEPQHITTENKTEDSVEGSNLNRDADAIDANIIDPTRVDVTATNVLSEQEPVESQLEEKHKDEAPGESEHPEPDVEVDASGPTESTNETVGDTKDSVEDSEQSKYVPAKGPEDENTSQDGVSVLESEMDSESKIDHGSPATIKPDVESDSGSSSAADSNSLDLNLSISSFLSKTKEGSSISLQVHHTLLHYERVIIAREIPWNVFVMLKESKRQKKTLKKTRKFMVDGVEVSVTTSKIVTDNDAKNEEMRFLRWACVLSA